MRISHSWAVSLCQSRDHHRLRLTLVWWDIIFCSQRIVFRRVDALSSRPLSEWSTWSSLFGTTEVRGLFCKLSHDVSFWHYGHSGTLYGRWFTWRSVAGDLVWATSLTIFKFRIVVWWRIGCSSHRMHCTNDTVLCCTPDWKLVTDTPLVLRLASILDHLESFAFFLYLLLFVRIDVSATLDALFLVAWLWESFLKRFWGHRYVIVVGHPTQIPLGSDNERLSLILELVACLHSLRHRFLQVTRRPMHDWLACACLRIVVSWYTSQESVPDGMHLLRAASWTLSVSL